MIFRLPPGLCLCVLGSPWQWSCATFDPTILSQLETERVARRQKFTATTARNDHDDFDGPEEPLGQSCLTWKVQNLAQQKAILTHRGLPLLSVPARSTNSKPLAWGIRIASWNRFFMFCLLRSSWKFHEFANLDVSIYIYIHFYPNSYFIELPRPVFFYLPCCVRTCCCRCWRSATRSWRRTYSDCLSSADISCLVNGDTNGEYGENLG